MPRFRDQCTNLDALDPIVLHNFFNQNPLFGPGFQHASEQRSALARRQVVDGWRARGLGGVLGLGGRDVRREQVVGQLSDPPGKFLEVKAVIDDAASPNVHETSVIRFVIELLGSDVRLASAKSGGHVHASFPRKSVNGRGAVVTNLQLSFGVEEEVLRLDVTMRYTLAMQVLHSQQNLLERALDFAGTHATALDGGVEISARAVFHDFAPCLMLVLNEVDCFDDVGVVERGADAELGSQLLDVLLLRLVLAALAEFLDCVEFLFLPIPLVGETDDAGGTFTKRRLVTEPILLGQTGGAFTSDAGWTAALGSCSSWFTASGTLRAASVSSVDKDVFTTGGGIGSSARCRALARESGTAPEELIESETAVGGGSATGGLSPVSWCSRDLIDGRSGVILGCRRSRWCGCGLVPLLLDTGRIDSSGTCSCSSTFAELRFAMAGKRIVPLARRGSSAVYVRG